MQPFVGRGAVTRRNPGQFVACANVVVAVSTRLAGVLAVLAKKAGDAFARVGIDAIIAGAVIQAGVAGTIIDVGAIVAITFKTFVAGACVAAVGVGAGSVGVARIAGARLAFIHVFTVAVVVGVARETVATINPAARHLAQSVHAAIAIVIEAFINETCLTDGHRAVWACSETFMASRGVVTYL